MTTPPEHNLMAITLRLIRPQDIEYFSKWWRDPDLIKVTSGDTTELSDAQISEYFGHIIKPHEALHYMVDLNNKTIGHISLQKREGPWWETQIVLGDKASRGKGYGVQAIHQLLDKAMVQGIDHIYLEVRPENTRAIKTYQKVGFSQVGGVIETGNKLQPQLIRMELLQNT